MQCCSPRVHKIFHHITCVMILCHVMNLALLPAIDSADRLYNRLRIQTTSHKILTKSTSSMKTKMFFTVSGIRVKDNPSQGTMYLYYVSLKPMNKQIMCFRITSHFQIKMSLAFIDNLTIISEHTTQTQKTLYVY